MRIFSLLLFFSLMFIHIAVGKNWNSTAHFSVVDTSKTYQLCLPANDTQLVPDAPAGGLWTASCGSCIDAQGVFHPAGLNEGFYLATYELGSIQEDILISLFANPTVAIDAMDLVNCGQKVTLTASGALTYQWATTTPANILSCNPCESPFYIADSTRTFSVTGTDLHGCSSTANVTVNVRPMDDVEIPNAFTPNGDQNNDIFRPICRDNVFKDYHLSIYSRWGERVFETITPGEGWNGKTGDVDLSSDVYVYVLEYEFIVNGKPDKKAGEVTLIR